MRILLVVFLVAVLALVVYVMRDEDARRCIEVRRAAVRRTAAADYSQEIIDAWAPWPITPEFEARLIAADTSNHSPEAERIRLLLSLLALRDEAVFDLTHKAA